MSLSLEAKLDIHELLGRSAYAYDERKLDMLEACFSEDAQFSMRIAGGDLIGPFVGRTAIMDLYRNSLAEQTDKRRHVVSNIFFESTQEQPVVISNLTLLATENGETRLLSAALYRDTLIHEQGQWRLLDRFIDLDKAY